MSGQYSTDGGFRPVLEILRSLYPVVQTLEEFTDGLQFPDGRKPVLLEETDGARFKKLLSGLIVCAYTPPQLRVPAQLSTLPEVLAFTLNHIKRKKLRNVLGFGYQCSDVTTSSDPFRFHGDVSQTAASISTSEVWKRINQRLGTEVTRYLLQDCAVFTTVPPSCVLQVCGEPVYDLLMPRSWSGFFLSNSDNERISGAMRKFPAVQKTVAISKKRTRDNEKYISVKRRRVKETVNNNNGNYRSLCFAISKKRAIDNEENISLKRRRMEETDQVAKIRNENHESQSFAISKKRARDNEENISLKRQRMEEIDQVAKIRNENHGSQSWKPADQRPPRPSQCSIRVLSMLYNGRGMKNFLLNRKLKGVGGARRMQGEDLVRMIFLQSESNDSKPKKLPKRFFAMVPLFSRLLRQHRKCPYRLFLQRKCAGNPDVKDMESLLKSHSSPYRVYLFVRECLRHIIPHELWGCQENQLHFLSNVKNFLLLGKFERLTLVQLMWRMKVQACHWLGPKKRQCASEHRYREWMLGQCMGWMLSGFVVGLVRAQFYITESMGHKHTLRFYRGDVWSRLQDQAFRAHLCKGQWRPLSPSQALKVPNSAVTSRIRFIPKTSSMRPITRLSGSRDTLQYFQSCVRVLQNVLSVCVREAPGPMGSTVWGWQDIHRRLQDFSPQQKSSPRPLYFVKVDVSGAYDSLPHLKLVEVLKEVLGPFAEQSFFLRQYSSVWSDPTRGLRKRFCTKAEMSEPLNMKGFVVDEQVSGRLHDAILVERHSSEVRGGDVFQFFQKMLCSYVIHYDQQMFRQVCGIPQGSSVSSLLCNLCYGHMEKALLKDIAKGGCLMRLIDDFLLITPHLSKATEFLTTLLSGVPDYGCQINPQKVAVNFPVCVSWVNSGVSVLPSSCLFPWCGLMIHTHTLDVYKDYSRYDGLSLRYSLTLGSAHSPSTVMKKLLSVLSIKSTDIFLDLRLNSVEAVYRSLYKLILLQALRFHACVRSLPLGQSVNRNPSFFLKMIWRMTRVTNKLLTHINKGLPVCSVDSGGVLQSEAVQLLFCLAFETLFRRFRSVYHCLIPALHKRKRALQRELCGITLARVRQASSPRIPLDFSMRV
ncbi:telomerase reverse transcriptase [Danio rerio]|uniref:Telomerase reverse transcriptase n=1 Tax=Danio rerio TaxID=7955 RepID=A2THE9_DANRE|nr:telomerase reverse transcriptase [Danio rerio]ABM92944.1 telomerase reverse transcriptase [Danio rerio]|eukprot:NP_001077335.1 telomerase reverse transcriptase [Danio rerio]